jgi:predicted GIY-YIG superfamily endonuclease
VYVIAMKTRQGVAYYVGSAASVDRRMNAHRRGHLSHVRGRLLWMRIEPRRHKRREQAEHAERLLARRLKSRGLTVLGGR